MNRYFGFATIVGLVGGVSTVGASGCSSDDAGSSTGGAAPDAGGSKENGATCAANAECKSSLCKTQGASGGGDAGATGTFCTIACAQAGQSDPTCTGESFTGKCTGQSFCQLK
jgi:hypothetical protein